MKRILLLTILIIPLLNCSNEKEVSQNLSNDFKKIIEDNDISSILDDHSTIEITANISINSYRKERDIISKKNGEIYINSFYSESSLSEIDLGTTQYEKVSNDSLNFEDLFRYLNRKDTIKTQENHLTFQVIYKTDTSNYYSSGLFDLIRNVGFYLYTKQRIFDESEIYKKLIPRPRL